MFTSIMCQIENAKWEKTHSGFPISWNKKQFPWHEGEWVLYVTGYSYPMHEFCRQIKSKCIKDSQAAKIRLIIIKTSPNESWPVWAAWWITFRDRRESLKVLWLCILIKNNFTMELLDIKMTAMMQSSLDPLCLINNLRIWCSSIGNPLLGQFSGVVLITQKGGAFQDKPEPGHILKTLSLVFHGIQNCCVPLGGWRVHPWGFTHSEGSRDSNTCKGLGGAWSSRTLWLPQWCFQLCSARGFMGWKWCQNLLEKPWPGMFGNSLVVGGGITKVPQCGEFSKAQLSSLQHSCRMQGAQGVKPQTPPPPSAQILLWKHLLLLFLGRYNWTLFMAKKGFHCKDW